MEEINESPLRRDLQRSILLGLRKKMPLGAEDVIQDLSLIDIDLDIVMTNLIYLAEHGLIKHGFKRHDYIGGTARYLQEESAVITADGMDFLEQDGGLSAVLGVVTVRLHDDTIKDLVAAKVMESALEPDDKKKYLDQLKSLPADATKHLAMKLLDLGVDKIQTGALGPLIDSVAKAFGG